MVMFKLVPSLRHSLGPATTTLATQVVGFVLSRALPTERLASRRARRKAEFAAKLAREAEFERTMLGTRPTDEKLI